MLSKLAGTKARVWLHDYAAKKSIYLKTCYFNPDHAHAVLDLPTSMRIEDVIQLFKGGSSHWINEQQLVNGHFAWAKGYGAFSVSESNLAKVVAYVNNQEEHHRKRSFDEELKLFVERHGLKWCGGETETVETVSNGIQLPTPPLKRGVTKRSNQSAIAAPGPGPSQDAPVSRIS